MQELSRRSAFGLAATAALAGVGVTASASASNPLTIPGRSAYLRGLGTDFRAAGSAGRFRMTLVDVVDLMGAGAVDPEQSFNLVFRPTSGGAPAGVYRLGADRVPEADVFLSPVGLEDRELQVVVNRSVRL